MPARVALYLRPAALESAGEPELVANGATNGGASQPPIAAPVAASYAGRR
jgi:hypothetical protein